MLNLAIEVCEPALSILDFRIECILMLAIDSISFQVFVSPIAEGDGSPCENIFNASIQAGTLTLCCRKRAFYDANDVSQSGLVSSFVTRCRARFEIVGCSCPQK